MPAPFAPATPLTQETARRLLAALLAVLRALLGGRAADFMVLPMHDHCGLDGCIGAGEALPWGFGPDEAAEDDVIWVMVPVPWRNAFWWVKPRARWQCAPAPVHRAPSPVPVRAPPCAA